MLILTYKGHILRNLHHFPEKNEKNDKIKKKMKKMKVLEKMNKNDAPDSLLPEAKDIWGTKNKNM